MARTLKQDAATRGRALNELDLPDESLEVLLIAARRIAGPMIAAELRRLATELDMPHLDGATATLLRRADELDPLKDSW